MKNGKGMKPKSKTIRVSQETSDRCEQLRLAMFPDRLTADCEAAPEAVRRTETKIIPFPGVSIGHEVTYQNALDNFLREIGHIK
jgi:hypothetical protein